MKQGFSHIPANAMNVSVSRGGEKYAIALGLENESESDDYMTSLISRPIEFLLRVVSDVVGEQAACGRNGWLIHRSNLGRLRRPKALAAFCCSA